MKNRLSIPGTHLIVGGLLAVATFVSVEKKTFAAESPPDPAHKNHPAPNQAGGQTNVAPPTPAAGPPRIRSMSNEGSNAKPMHEGMKGMSGMGGMSGATKPMQGMDMQMGKDELNVMGAMPGGALAQSALPGVPGVSHLYHIGAAGFFLDHLEHIQLSAEQQKKLNQIKESALLEKATADRNVEEAEQQLWKLTAADQPDLAQIEAKVREIEKLRADQRLALIRPVMEAAKALTEEQSKILVGTAEPGAPAMKGMPDMPAAKPASPAGKPGTSAAPGKPAAKPEHKH